MRRTNTSSLSLLSAPLIGVTLLTFNLGFSLPTLAKDVPSRKASQISIVKRKEAVFQLTDKLNRMSNPTKESLETLFKRDLQSKRLGFYESDVHPEMDMKSFQVSYGRKGGIASANIYLHANLNLQLADAKKHYGNYQKKFNDSLFIDDKNFPVLVYLFSSNRKKIYFSFLKKKPQAVEIHVSLE